MAYLPPISGNPVGAKSPTQQEFSIDGIVLDPLLFEVPQDFSWGLETWGSVHKIPQNSGSQPKIIAQTFGVFPKEVSWEGRFLGASAVDKSNAIAQIQVSQRVVKLVVGQRSWDVIIFDYAEEQRSRWDLGYKITLRPILERFGRISNATPATTAADTLKQQTTAMQALLASSAASDARAAAANAQFTAALAAIAAAQPELSQTIPTLLALTGTMTSCTGTFTALLATLQNSALPADVSLASYLQSSIAAQTSYSSTLMTVTGADRAVAPVLSNTNLFAVAANYLGDWTRATDLQAVNGITDTNVTAATSIAIPRI